MNKKITGVVDDKDKVRQELIINREMFRTYTTQLKHKKVEYQGIKLDNEKERE